ncbi:MAG: hypothetical protein JWQ27_1554 [Ferruginibacter sp.]|nr:hypothetical protein [Ferruginibacter sp.]
MDTVICRNCGNKFTGKYCNICGEKAYDEKDRSVMHLVGEGLHFITHFEGTFLTTLKSVLFKPGQLSEDYCNGIRKRYFKPLSFFLMLVIIYLLFPLFNGLNQILYAHMQQSVYGKFATKEVTKIIATGKIDYDTLADAFHHKAEQISKFLLFILIPVMACFSWLLGYRKRSLYYDHFIFSIEAVSVLILWGFLICPVILFSISPLLPADFFETELYTGIIMGGGFAIFVATAARRFFNFKRWYSMLYALLYTFCLMLFVQFVYKLILFYIAIHLVKV